jgi:hypothetical protein
VFSSSEQINMIEANYLKREMPQLYIDLFAKYLVAGTPLEPLLPLTNRNVSEELG